jgi:hypothetical protein
MRLYKKRWFKLLAVSIAVVVLSVILFSIFNDGKDTRNFQDFINELSKKGYSIDSVEAEKDSPGFFDDFNGSGSSYRSRCYGLNIHPARGTKNG